eukprot:g49.t1
MEIKSWGLCSVSRYIKLPLRFKREEIEGHDDRGGSKHETFQDLGEEASAPLPIGRNVEHLYIIANSPNDQPISWAPSVAVRRMLSWNSAHVYLPLRAKRAKKTKILEGAAIKVLCIVECLDDRDATGKPRQKHEHYNAYVLEAEAAGTYRVLWKDAPFGGQEETGVRRERIEVTESEPLDGGLVLDRKIKRKGVEGSMMSWYYIRAAKEDDTIADDQSRTWTAEQNYEVEAIVNHTTGENSFDYYEVKWVGYGPKYNAEMPLRGMVDCVHKLNDYLAQYGMEWDGKSDSVKSQKLQWHKKRVKRHNVQHCERSSEACCMVPPEWEDQDWMPGSEWEISAIVNHTLPLNDASRFEVHYEGWGRCFNEDQCLRDLAHAHAMLNSYLEPHGMQLGSQFHLLQDGTTEEVNLRCFVMHMH